MEHSKQITNWFTCQVNKGVSQQRGANTKGVRQPSPFCSRRSRRFHCSTSFLISYFHPYLNAPILTHTWREGELRVIRRKKIALFSSFQRVDLCRASRLVELDLSYFFALLYSGEKIVSLFYLIITPYISGSQPFLVSRHTEYRKIWVENI